MANHVAVLRRVREFLAQPLINDPEAVAALDHAIATCETWMDADGTVWRPPTAWAYAQACRVLNETKAKHAALVARLGEADALIRRVIDANWRTNDNTLYPALLAWADHAARAQTTRVVAGNGGGDGR